MDDKFNSSVGIAIMLALSNIILIIILFHIYK
jgi:hypothetical protein